MVHQVIMERWRSWRRKEVSSIDDSRGRERGAVFKAIFFPVREVFDGGGKRKKRILVPIGRLPVIGEENVGREKGRLCRGVEKAIPGTGREKEVRESVASPPFESRAGSHSARHLQAAWRKKSRGGSRCVTSQAGYP